MHMPPTAATSIQATHSGGRPRAQLVPSVDACAPTCGCLRARRRSSIGDVCTGSYYIIVFVCSLPRTFQRRAVRERSMSVTRTVRFRRSRRLAMLSGCFLVLWTDVSLPY